MTANWLDLPAGAALTRWAMADPVVSLYPGTRRPMPDRVDYRFRNGWVDTGPLPCREAWLAALPGRRVDRPDGPFPHLVIAQDGPDLDFSQFRHRPTLIARAFRCRVRAERGGTARFRVATCGGVHLWAGERLVGAFQPFQRNTPRETEFETVLEAGETVLTLLLEDLHERDTTCFFALTYLGGPGLALRAAEGSEPAALSDAAEVLAGLTIERVFHDGGTARLVAARQPERPMALVIDAVQPFDRGGLVRDPAPGPRRTVTLEAGRAGTDLFLSDQAPPGCLSVTVAAEVSGARLTRHLGTTNLPAGQPLPGTLAERKACAADLIADHAGFEPSVALLLALRGQAPAHVDRVVGAALTTIEERHDCSDFSILPLLRLWRDAPDGVTPATRARLHRAILGYRYWLDEPGDDVMWFWSENHVLCFHTAQLVAGGLFPDAVFPNSGKTGAQHAAQAAARLDRWFASIDAHGLCEWNSAAYYPIDLLGLFTLHDMAPAFRARAAAVIDRVFVMTGLHTTGGVPAGSQGRCYEKELLAGPATELGSVAAIAFGGAFLPGYDRAAALFCLSDYAPPEAAARFAVPRPGDRIEARYTQGLDHAGRLALWKSARGQLSTVADLAPGEKGHQAHVVDVQLAAHPMARLWINHPGDVKVWGERRPSLLAGNHVMPRVAQHGPTALVIHDVDRPWTDLRFAQVFAPDGAFDGWQDRDGWRIFAAGPDRVAVWCSCPLRGVEGAYRGSLFRAMTAQSGWVVALPLPGEDPDAFAARLGTPAFDAAALRLRASGADGAKLELDFAMGLSVDGRAMPFAPLSSTVHVGMNGAPLRPWTAPA